MGKKKNNQKNQNNQNEKKLYGQKNMVPLMIMDILEKQGDSEIGLTQNRIMEIIEKEYGVSVSRNTLRKWIEDLEDAGCAIHKTHAGVKYTGREFADGEIRQVIDQIRSNPFLEEYQKNEMIGHLLNFGTPSFRRIMTGYLQFKNDNCYPLVNSIPDSVSSSDITEAVELIQKAIFSDQRVSFNYYSFIYDDGIRTVKVYSEPIVVNPFDLAYKGDKYYLVGSLRDSKEVKCWRVEKICDLSALKEIRDPVPATISAHGGVVGYANMQPELRGGSIERFRIQCSADDIDEIVDIFGTALREAPVERNKHRNAGVLVLDVFTTRESMKSWAIANSKKIFVIEPEDFYGEIVEILSDASRAYHTAEREREDPNYKRMKEHMKRFRERVESEVFEDRVRDAENNNRLSLDFSPLSRRNLTADLALMKNLTGLKRLSLHNCTITNLEALENLSELTSIDLRDCEYDETLLAKTVNPDVFTTDSITAAKCVASENSVRRLQLCGLNVRSLSELGGIKKISSLLLRACRKLRDVSVLTEDPAFSALTELRIDYCEALADFSFVKKIPSLKSLYINSPCFDLEDALKLKEETGIERIEFSEMEKCDDEILKKLGLNEEELLRIHRYRERHERLKELRNNRNSLKR